MHVRLIQLSLSMLVMWGEVGGDFKLPINAKLWPDYWIFESVHATP